MLAKSSALASLKSSFGKSLLVITLEYMLAVGRRSKGTEVLLAIISRSGQATADLYTRSSPF